MVCLAQAQFAQRSSPRSCFQTVVLVALDVAMGPESALTTRAASLVLGLEGLLVIVVFTQACARKCSRAASVDQRRGEKL